VLCSHTKSACWDGFRVAPAAPYTSVIFITSHDRNLTIQTITNIVIALATVVAVIINFFSIKNQKDSRQWEVSKSILLELSTTLSDLISQTGELAEEHFKELHGIPEEQQFAPDNSIYKKFSRHLNHTVDVYGPILNMGIVEAIEVYKKTDRSIEIGLNEGSLDMFEAYDMSFGAQQKLQKVLSNNIKKYANI